MEDQPPNDPPLFRNAECAALRLFLCRGGGGRVLWICGPQGCGKTAVVEWCLQGSDVHRCRGPDEVRAPLAGVTWIPNGYSSVWPHAALLAVHRAALWERKVVVMEHRDPPGTKRGPCTLIPSSVIVMRQYTRGELQALGAHLLRAALPPGESQDDKLQELQNCVGPASLLQTAGTVTLTSRAVLGLVSAVQHGTLIPSDPQQPSDMERAVHMAVVTAREVSERRLSKRQKTSASVPDVSAPHPRPLKHIRDFVAKVTDGHYFMEASLRLASADPSAPGLSLALARTEAASYITRTRTQRSVCYQPCPGTLGMAFSTASLMGKQELIPSVPSAKRKRKRLSARSTDKP